MICKSEKPYNFTDINKETDFTQLNDFTVIDIETTGFGDRAGIVELAAVKFKDGKLYDTFNSLINPQIPIPPSATMVHGIHDADVADSPSIWEVMPYFEKFIGNSTLVGHNVSFDLNFLIKKGMKLNLKNRKIFDTLKIARKYVVADNHKLENLMPNYKLSLVKKSKYPKNFTNNLNIWKNNWFHIIVFWLKSDMTIFFIESFYSS